LFRVSLWETDVAGHFFPSFFFFFHSHTFLLFCRCLLSNPPTLPDDARFTSISAADVLFPFFFTGDGFCVSFAGQRYTDYFLYCCHFPLSFKRVRRPVPWCILLQSSHVQFYRFFAALSPTCFSLDCDPILRGPETVSVVLCCFPSFCAVFFNSISPPGPPSWMPFMQTSPFFFSQDFFLHPVCSFSPPFTISSVQPSSRLHFFFSSNG